MIRSIGYASSTGTRQPGAECRCAQDEGEPSDEILNSGTRVSHTGLRRRIAHKPIDKSKTKPATGGVQQSAHHRQFEWVTRQPHSTSRGTEITRLQTQKNRMQDTVAVVI